MNSEEKRAMTCPRCSATLEAGARFCGVCGHRLESQAAGVAATDPEAPPVVPPDAGADPRGPRPAGGKPRPRTESKKLSPIAAALAAASDAYIGTTLNGRFTIEKKLGEGGFGAVYNGLQLLTGRKVAIKLLHPEMTRDENVVARFRREGQVLCSLRDAHTITTYDFDQTADGTLFIAMELLQGRSLHEVFHDEAPVAWPRMLKIMSEMCSSLEEAHSLGIVHRDLKPENVYLESRPGNPEFVKILDFGIAKVMRGEGSSGMSGNLWPQLTATGQTLGTLEYMSPEQLMGKPLDGRSDIYGMGVLAFELLTGRLPFPEAIGPAALISAQLKKTPPAASKINFGGGIPARVDQLLLRMLAKEKNQRFRDVGELRREIDGILASLGPTVETAPPPSSASASPAPAAPPWSAPPPPPLSPAAPVPPPSARPAAPPAPADAPSPQPHAPDERPMRSSSAPPPWPVPSAAPVVAGPAAAALGLRASPDAITTRSAPLPPIGQGPGRNPGAGPGHGDSPWAGMTPAGSAVARGLPRSGAGDPAAAAPPPQPGPWLRRSPGVAGPAPIPWWWIAVAAVLFLAVVVGGMIALR